MVGNERQKTRESIMSAAKKPGFLYVPQMNNTFLYKCYSEFFRRTDKSER